MVVGWGERTQQHRTGHRKGQGRTHLSVPAHEHLAAHAHAQAEADSCSGSPDSSGDAFSSCCASSGAPPPPRAILAPSARRPCPALAASPPATTLRTRPRCIRASPHPHRPVDSRHPLPRGPSRRAACHRGDAWRQDTRCRFPRAALRGRRARRPRETRPWPRVRHARATARARAPPPPPPRLPTPRAIVERGAPFELVKRGLLPGATAAGPAVAVCKIHEAAAAGGAGRGGGVGERRRGDRGVRCAAGVHGVDAGGPRAAGGNERARGSQRLAAPALRQQHRGQAGRTLRAHLHRTPLPIQVRNLVHT